ncbi:hypothetical protein [Aeromicrobium sp.]|uniref:hypothetical protein n=1 Tax=Aeromicrobium sp. TaxID=1871063 RepID=UPI0030BD59EB
MSAPSTSSGAEHPEDIREGSTDDLPDIVAPTAESTGDPRIDEALERLDGLGERDITDHPAEFDAIHRVLRESLANAGRDGDLPGPA